MSAIDNEVMLSSGRLVEAIMRYRGYSVNELADAIHEHPMNVYKLLNGRRVITPTMCKKLSSVLRFNPTILMASLGCEMKTEDSPG